MSDPIETAAAALATDPAAAERQARALGLRAPGDPRPRLILASALRRLGRAAEALPVLMDLARTWPQAARTRYELGLSLIAVGRDDDGNAQLDAAVTLDPAHREAWQAIEAQAFAQGDTPRETRARAAQARLDHADPAIGRAAEAIVLGRIDEAERALQAICRQRPDDAEGARLLACCYIESRAFDHAETLLRHALALRPDFALARFDLARVLFQRQTGEPALAELASLLAADPDNAAYLNLQAACLALLGDDLAAAALQAQLATRYPGNPRVAINHGHALRTAGQRDLAIAAYRRALALRPETGEAWWGLANLKVGALDDRDARTMQALLDGPLPDEDRMHVAYALGRRAEDAGNVDDAFDRYILGAKIARARTANNLAHASAELVATRAVFTPDFMAARSDWGDGELAPIFIVGLPRSGSTLVEQILASHPAVEGTMELPFMPAMADAVARNGGIARASRENLQDWGAHYLAQTVVHRRLGRARFIDKMPNNFRHIGLIRLILPQARIIDVRRHPMASGYSCFKQLFAEGQEFSYDLTDIADYYRHYLATVRHFHAVAPGAVHTLIYEDLIDDIEGQVRRLLDYCGLPFDPATLRFFENDRAVRTVSSEQVRQPIYRSGLDHWRAFETHLAPLAAGLGDALETWRD